MAKTQRPYPVAHQIRAAFRLCADWRNDFVQHVSVRAAQHALDHPRPTEGAFSSGVTTDAAPEELLRQVAGDQVVSEDEFKRARAQLSRSAAHRIGRWQQFIDAHEGEMGDAARAAGELLSAMLELTAALIAQLGHMALTVEQIRTVFAEVEVRDQWRRAGRALGPPSKHLQLWTPANVLLDNRQGPEALDALFEKERFAPLRDAFNACLPPLSTELFGVGYEERRRAEIFDSYKVIIRTTRRKRGAFDRLRRLYPSLINGYASEDVAFEDFDRLIRAEAKRRERAAKTLRAAS